MIGVNATYRLAPAHRWPAGSDDVAAVVRWVREHIGEYGGDPERIFLMGQSAGAAHVAAYVARGGVPLAGALLLSGLYDPAVFEPSPLNAAYYGDDPALFATQSSLEGHNHISALLELNLGESSLTRAITDFIGASIPQ